MDSKNFYYLLQTENKLKESKTELCNYCIANIKRRLILVHGMLRGSDKLNDTAHEILLHFLNNKPKHYIFAPFKYVNRITDNFMAIRYKNKKADLPLNKDIAYEQRFQELEKADAYKFLLKHLDERAARIVFMSKVEEISELQISIDTGLTYPNVRAIISRSLKKLKIILKDVTNFDDESSL